MKQLIPLILLLLVCTISIAQVGIGTTTPDASSMLEIRSNNKGLLIPRTSTTSRNAIISPAKGLLVYDTTTTSFWSYTGAAWSEVANVNGLTVDGFAMRLSLNGFSAGYVALDGNVFWGLGSGEANISATNNVGIGMDALKNNFDRPKLVAIGDSALFNNGVGASFPFEGANNIAVGSKSMYNNTTGFSNTALGSEALISNISGSSNTAAGFDAMYSNTTGFDNTAIGKASLFQNSTGQNNTAVGSAALQTNTVSNNNTAVGYSGLKSNIGDNNTAVGSNALMANTIGADNTSIGNLSLSNNLGGNFNTAIGSNVLGSNLNGDENTGMGYLALSNNLGGFRNTAVGELAGPSIGGATNTLCLGSFASVDASNKTRIGDNSMISIGGQVGWSTLSDGRYKQLVKEDIKGLDFIRLLRPVSYIVDLPALDKRNPQFDKLSGKSLNQRQSSYDRASSHRESGFIAQEVEKTAQKLGMTFSGVDVPSSENGLYALRYADFVVPLVKAVQEQQQLIDKQQKEIDELKDLVKTLMQK